MMIIQAIMRLSAYTPDIKMADRGRGSDDAVCEALERILVKLGYTIQFKQEQKLAIKSLLERRDLLGVFANGIR